MLNVCSLLRIRLYSYLSQWLHEFCFYLAKSLGRDLERVRHSENLYGRFSTLISEQNAQLRSRSSLLGYVY